MSSFLVTIKRITRTTIVGNPGIVDILYHKCSNLASCYAFDVLYGSEVCVWTNQSKSIDVGSMKDG